ncbi:hypothetical protein KSP35_14970 [Aquihabitans sp. G128]|uniref:hypothetical protein n=1 Tax=Aquihabitans sp. G128 TaxID=2849779 RepID=UPI001C24B1EF|nr:hypothetical protein [Aquihabitans sp. G128]QXC59678.1 hypothetical protein KSP35_14970 [Aquihabitans sp. G128]
MSGGKLPSSTAVLPAGLAATGVLGPVGLWAVIGAVLVMVGFALVRTSYLARNAE